MVQRSVAVPDEIDALALQIQASDPDITYSMAIRKILRAGMRQIESEQRIHDGKTQIDMERIR